MRIVQNLRNYQANRCFEKMPEKRSHRDDYLLDLVFEVIYIERRSDRSIFVGWNGNSNIKFKSSNLVSLEDLWYGISLQAHKCKTYDYDFLKSIHKREGFINLTIFDPFLQLSDSVRLFDFVFMPKVLITISKHSDERYYYRYNFALRSQRTIRVCHPQSSIGKIFEFCLNL